MPRSSKLRQELRQTRPFRSPHVEGVMGLLRTADVLRRHFASVYQPYDITAQQYNVLRILRGARPEPLPTMEIAERMIERTPGITRLLDQLERRGLVSRERYAKDRRCVLCTVTAAGLELLAELDRPVDEADDAALSMLSAKEAEHLIELLDRVRGARE